MTQHSIRPATLLGRLPFLAVAWLAFAGCEKDPVIVVGDAQSVDIGIRVLPEGLLDDVGAFEVAFVVDGRSAGSGILVVDGASASWLDNAAPEIDAGKMLEVAVVARRLSDDERFNPSLVGRSVPTPIDGLRDGDKVAVSVLMSPVGEVHAHPTSLAHRRVGHSAHALDDGRVVVFGGASGGSPVLAPIAEVFDPVVGNACRSDAPGVGCSFGTLPAARTDHVSVRLADGFGEDCPMKDALLVGLGGDDAGTARGDLFLFAPAGLDGAGAFTSLDGVPPRRGAVAAATRDCRVVIIGGENDDGPVRDISFVTFSGDSVVVRNEPNTFVADVVRPRLVRLDNGPDELVVFGGADTAGAWIFEGTSQDPDFCDLSSVACNGAAQGPVCAQREPSVVRLGSPGGLPAFVLLGDETGGDCVAAPTLLRAGLSIKAGFFAAPVVSGMLTPRHEGAVVVPTAPATVLAIGGRDENGVALASVERLEFDLGPDDAGDGTATANLLSDLDTGLSGAVVVSLGDVTLILGGVDETGTTLADVRSVARTR